MVFKDMYRAPSIRKDPAYENLVVIVLGRSLTVIWRLSEVNRRESIYNR